MEFFNRYFLHLALCIKLLLLRRLQVSRCDVNSQWIFLTFHLSGYIILTFWHFVGINSVLWCWDCICSKECIKWKKHTQVYLAFVPPIKLLPPNKKKKNHLLWTLIVGSVLMFMSANHVIMIYIQVSASRAC